MEHRFTNDAKIFKALCDEKRLMILELLQSGEKSVNVPALTAQNVLDIDLSQELVSRTDPREKYLEYSIMENGKVLSFGTTLFVRPKEFTFLEPAIARMNSP